VSVIGFTYVVIT